MATLAPGDQNVLISVAYHQSYQLKVEPNYVRQRQLIYQHSLLIKVVFRKVTASNPVRRTTVVKLNVNIYSLNFDANNIY